MPRQPHTLVGWLAAVVSAQPARPAVLADGELWSYAELWARAEAVARRLAREPGFSAGRCVALLSANDPRYLSAYLGVMRAGGIVVPLNPMLTVDDVRTQLALIDPVAVIVDDERPYAHATLADAAPLWRLHELGSGPAVPLPELDAAAPASVLLTSGSTGQPKGVMHTQGSLLHAGLQLGSALPFTSADRNVAFLPFFASIPELVLPTLLTGGSLDVVRSFDVERVSRACVEATGIDAVPTIMARLLDHGDLDELRRLRWVMFASEPMPVPLLEQWWELLPGVETHQLYGMTEVLPITVAPDWLLRAHPASVGVPFSTSRVQVVDPDGAALPPGRSGEITCQSPARMEGYLNDEAATVDATTGEGAMKTGDLGSFDEGGRLFLTGRAKDLIITGGLNVAPAEIEAVACRHPLVASAAVVGIPDARWGETPVVVVVPAPGLPLTALEVLEHCRRELASFKRPSGAAVVDALPLTGIGKSAKAAIRQQIIDGTIPLLWAGERAAPT